MSQDEVVQALGGLNGLGWVPIDFELDAGRFGAKIEDGSWGSSHGEVWRRAQDLRELLQRTPYPRLIYNGGTPAVAHAVAFGAYLGDQWSVEPCDFHNAHEMA